MTTVDTEPPPTTYSTVELVALTGASYRRIDWLCRTGRLTETAHGTGTHRTFTDADLALIRSLVALQDIGLALDPALALAKDIAAGRTVVVPLPAAVLTVQPDAATAPQLEAPHDDNT